MSIMNIYSFFRNFIILYYSHAHSVTFYLKCSTFICPYPQEPIDITKGCSADIVERMALNLGFTGVKQQQVL